MTKNLLFFLLLVAAVLCGCQNTESEPPREVEIPTTMLTFQQAFKEADEVTFYRIYPDINKPESEDEEFFYNNLVVRTVKLPQAESQAPLSAFWQDYDPNASAAFCFRPHHGLSAKWKDQKYELEICYSCSQVKARLDGQYVDGWLWKADNYKALDSVLEWDQASAIETENRLRTRSHQQ